MKQRAQYLMVIGMLVIILLPQMHAEQDQLLLLRLTFAGDKIAAVEPFVIAQDNPFYKPELQDMAHDTPVYSETDVLVVLDAKGNILASSPVAYLDTLVISLEDTTTIDAIEVQRDNVPYLHNEIRFCDNDTQCEPCLGEACTLIETSLTCNDCPSGNADRYCDRKKDAICDPDCNNNEDDCADTVMLRPMEQGVEIPPSASPLCGLLKDGICEASCPQKDLDCNCGDGRCASYENQDNCPMDCQPKKSYTCTLLRDNVCDIQCAGFDIDCEIISLINTTVGYYERDENFYGRTMAILTVVIVLLFGISMWLLHDIYNIKFGEP